MQNTKAVQIGCGHYLPDNKFYNSDFDKKLNTSDDWITARTGIKARHFANEKEKTSDLAIAAGKMALSETNIKPNAIDAIIVATSTPDQTFPSTATRVQFGLGMTTGYAFDIQAVCTGFIYALANANSLICSGQAKRVMVIGAEIFSRILDWTDRSTCVLFGDGAGAIILEARNYTNNKSNRGILATDLHSDGKYNNLLYVDGGVSTTRTSGVLHMEGKEIFKHAIDKLTNTSENCLKMANLAKEDISWMVPHQANLRIIKNTARRLGISMNRVILTLNQHGNTSAASIPLALSCSNQQNKFKTDDILIMEAIGGGLTWGSVVIRW